MTEGLRNGQRKLTIKARKDNGNCSIMSSHKDMCVHKARNKVTWVDMSTGKVTQYKPGDKRMPVLRQTVKQSVQAWSAHCYARRPWNRLGVWTSPKVDLDQTTRLSRNLMHRIWPRNGGGLRNSWQNTQSTYTWQNTSKVRETCRTTVYWTRWIYLSIYLVVYSLHRNVLPTLQSVPLMTNGPLYPITQDSSCHGQHTMPRNPWSFPTTSSA